MSALYGKHMVRWLGALACLAISACGRAPEAPPDGFEVRVLAGGRPVGGAQVHVSAQGYDHDARTDDRGIASLPQPPEGGIRIRIDHPDHVPYVRDVRTPREGRIDQRIKQGSELVGCVRDEEGRPIADAHVTVFDPAAKKELGRARTDREGRYRIRRLESGLVKVSVHTGRHRPVAPRQVELAGEAEVGFDLRTGDTIQGRVYLPDGTPAAGATVGCSGPGARFQVSDSSGRFTLGGLEESPVHVFARLSGFAARMAYNVPPGTEGLELKLERGGTVTGSIRHQGRLDATVSLWAFHPGFGRSVRMMAAAASGFAPTFRFEHVPSGTYELRVASGSIGSTTRTVEVVSPRETDLGPIGFEGEHR